MSTQVVTEPYLPPENSRRRTFRFAGPRATSQWVVLPILCFLSLNVTTLGVVEKPVDQLLLFQITLGAFVCAWGYFTLVGFVINALLPKLGNPRNWAIAILYATTEMFRTVVLYWFSVTVGLPSVADWMFRITGGLTTGLVIFAIVSTVLNDSSSYGAAFRELISQRVKLQVTITASQENLLRTREQLIENARSQISLALGNTQSESLKTSPEYGRIVDQLFHVTEDVVRPLSHDLFDNPIALVSPSEVSKPPRVPFLTFLKDSSVASPFRPGLMVLISALLTTPSLFLVMSWSYFVAWAAALTVFFVLILLAKRYLTPVLPRVPYLLRILIIGFVFVVPAVIFTTVVFSALFEGQTASINSLLYGAALGLGLGMLVATSGGLRASRVRMLTEISDINDQLFWLNARLQSELWLDQKNLALTLHNEVQATLLAAALKLKAALAGESGNAQAVMPEVRELIARSVNFASAPLAQRSLTDAVARINQNWAGLIEMKYTATEQTLATLHQDPVTLGVLEDVLSEFQNNSLKHGHATETTVILTMPDIDVMQVAMSNNGHRLNTSIEGGLGSHFLKSVSLNYKFENFSRGVRLVVQLPVSKVSE